MSVEQRQPYGSLVSSFETGIVVQNGLWLGICVKLAMYDGTEKLMHWMGQEARSLEAGLSEYASTIGYNSLMFRAKNDPSIEAGLPERHPFHTLLSEIPKLSASEIGNVRTATKVISPEFVSRGETLELRANYEDNHSENLYFHEYTAISLFGYVKEMLERGAALSGPAGGSA